MSELVELDLFCSQEYQLIPQAFKQAIQYKLQKLKHLKMNIFSKDVFEILFLR